MTIDKFTIRTSLRQQRQKLDHPTQKLASAKAATLLIQTTAFLNSECIAYYISDEGELDPLPIIKCAEQLGKKLFLPFMSNDHTKLLYFYPYSSKEALQKNKDGIQEPIVIDKQPVKLQKLNIVLLPVVGFDEKCNRLGRGSGYYDRTFAFVKERPHAKRPILVGLAYNFQKVTDIQTEVWDVPVDIVVTESKIYQRIPVA